MNWVIAFSDEAIDYLEKNRLAKEEIFDLVRKSIFKFRGEPVNIDIKKLKGAWQGFYRIRKGKLRLIVEFDFDNLSALVERIDWRGSAYKR